MAAKRRSSRVPPADRSSPLRPSNGGKTLPPEPLSPDEVARLIRACSTRAPTGVRNRALIAVLYRAGIRLGEALSLQPKDLDSDAGTLTVLHGKGDRRRTVGMDPGAFAMVERWMDVRRKRGIRSRAPVFCTLDGRPLKDAYVRALFPRLARKAGIEKRVHAHGLRHTIKCLTTKTACDKVSKALISYVSLGRDE